VGLTSISITISDGINSVGYTLSVTTVLNQPPAFLTNPVTQSLSIGSSSIYNLPSFSDPEGDPVTLGSTGVIPAFASLSGSSLTLNPQSTSDQGTYSLTITLSDGVSTVSYPLSLVITVPSNQPPAFNEALVD
jgi:hypothetical protein